MWIGYVGDGDRRRIKNLLGADAGLHSGDRFAIGASGSGTSTLARLHVHVNGAIEAGIGDDIEAGCSALVDPASSCVKLRRDRFGLHSVYYGQSGNALWFSSRLNFLQSCLPQCNGLNLAALHGYLTFSYVPNPLTLVSGINSLPAGCTLTGSASGIQIAAAPSWAAGASEPGKEEDAESALLGLLRSAVQRKIPANGSVGVFLSGGLDSSLIAALLVECGVRPELFTLDFGDIANGTDLACARLVARHLGCSLTVVQADARKIQETIPQAATAFDQPFGDGAALPLLLLGKAAANSVGTVFNGEGGDQLFGGWTNKPMIAAEVYGGSSEEYCRESAYLDTFHRFHELTDRLYAPRLKAAASSVDAREWIRCALREGGYRSVLHQLRAANLALKGAQNIAPRSVQAAAACGLSLQSPFFDEALTQWSFRLGAEWLLNGACEKYLLKRAAEKLLPSEVVWREKRGMGVPTTDWCLGPLKKDVSRILNRRDLQRDGLFEPQFVETLMRGDDLPGEFRRRRIGEKLWTLLMFQIWRKEHIRL